MKKIKFFAVIFSLFFIPDVSLRLSLYWLFGPSRRAPSIEYIFITSSIVAIAVCVFIAYIISSKGDKEE
ncbi:hypothetical protein [Shouchella clausii]|uniref:hypothetical protein n=1 Tax=Shouchella clausii TaxID=79880 RepID=UPI000BA75DC5|nr:hypothetical protein [Shouchella clausii]PAE91147.1 hypothetical protein CHH70_20510 [Shouchella clausii]